MPRWDRYPPFADSFFDHARDVEDRVPRYHADATPPMVKHFLHIEPGTSSCQL